DCEQPRDLRLLRAAVDLEHHYGVVQPHAAVEDTPDCDAAEVVARIEVGDEHLERRGGIAAWRRYVRDDGIEERPEVFAGNIEIRGGGACPAARVQDGKLDLL